MFLVAGFNTFLEKNKCTLENAIAIFNTEAKLGSRSIRKMADGVSYISCHVNQ